MFDVLEGQIVTTPCEVVCPHCEDYCFKLDEIEDVHSFHRVLLQDCMSCGKPVRVHLKQTLDKDGFYAIELWVYKELTKSDRHYLGKDQEAEVVSLPLNITELSIEASELYWTEGKKQEHASHEELMRAVVLMICSKFNLKVNGTIK